MKTIDYVINNYKQFETSIIDDRFGRRLCAFLTVDQMEMIGWHLKNEELRAKHKAVEFTKENVIAQLRSDVEFGWEKACNHRGISAELMYNVVLAWCRILEDGLETWEEDNYTPYGTPLFIAVAEKYGWQLEGEYRSYDDEDE